MNPQELSNAIHAERVPAATVEEIAARIMRHCLSVHQENPSKVDAYHDNCPRCRELQGELDATLGPDIRLRETVRR